MKAKKWVVLFAAFLFLSVSAIVIVTLTKPETGDNETTAPSQKEVVLINDEALAALFAEANTMLNTHTTIALNNNMFIQNYMLINSVDASESTNTEDTISLNVKDHPREELQYLVFLSLIADRYEGCYITVPGSGMPYLPYFILCTEYKASGYSTIYEYLSAVKSGEASTPSNVYKISFTSKSITRYEGSPDLYPELSGTGTK